MTQALPNRAPETQVSEKSANSITRLVTCYPPQPHQTGWFDEGYQGNLTPGFLFSAGTKEWFGGYEQGF